VKETKGVVARAKGSSPLLRGDLLIRLAPPGTSGWVA
jgi:hypothetical protein